MDTKTDRMEKEKEKTRIYKFVVDGLQNAGREIDLVKAKRGSMEEQAFWEGHHLALLSVKSMLTLYGIENIDMDDRQSQ